jgi:hypothetical protein
LVGFQIEAFIGEEEACYIVIVLKKVSQMSMELLNCGLTMVILIRENNMKMNCQVFNMIIQG